MKTTHQTGLKAEKLCRLALRLKFYQILAVRYRTPVGEIDILAARGRTIVAVEVKARATTEDAAESVLPKQQQRIAAALQYFLARNPKHANADLRFDVMLVAQGCWPSHIENAWYIK